jgi:hypothetical protein
MGNNNLIRIDDTKFKFITNFAGDPERDRFGSDARQANIIIPDAEQAMALMQAGFNVKSTKPREDDDENFEPEYFIAIKVNYDTKWPPKIYLVSGNSDPVLLNEDTIGSIDDCSVANVNVILNPYENQRTGRKSLYVRTMYVEQNVDEDPFAHRYSRVRDDDAPF